MTTIDFITDLFCTVDERMRDVPKHSQASLYPSEIVTLGLLFTIKGVGNRAFYRWLIRDYLPLFIPAPSSLQSLGAVQCAFRNRRLSGCRFSAE